MSQPITAEMALSELRHRLVTALELCPDSEYEGIESAIELLDNYREEQRQKTAATTRGAEPAIHRLLDERMAAGQ